MTLLRPFIFLISFAGLSLYAHAAPPTVGAVSQLLSQAFEQARNENLHTKRLQITAKKKDHDGFVTKTITFNFGRKIYRIVFSSDGLVIISFMRAGDPAAQRLFKAALKKTTAQKIVNVIYSREFGKPYKPVLTLIVTEETKADRSAVQVKSKRSPLKSRKRKISTLSSGKPDLSPPTPASRPAPESSSRSASQLEQRGGASQSLCGSPGGASIEPQRSAIAQVTQTLSLLSALGSSATPNDPLSALGSTVARSDEAYFDSSREFKVQGRYSFLEELKKKKAKNPTFQASEFFKKLLLGWDRHQQDPYSQAAHKNYKVIDNLIGETARRRLASQIIGQMEFQGMEKTIRKNPHLPVTYDRKKNKFYVLTDIVSSSQAHYYLSLAAWYVTRLHQKDISALLQEYDLIQKKISSLENATLDEKDHDELVNKRKKRSQILKRLWRFSQSLFEPPGVVF